MSTRDLPPLALDVRRQDRERFVTALFAPTEKRQDLFVLYAFNAEIARIKSLVREPLAGAIRLQWWRDVVAQERPGSEIDHHPIAAPLTQFLASGQIPADGLLALLDARERDLNNDPFQSLAQMVAYADATAGNLSQSALQLLGANDEDSLKAGRGTAIAYALLGLLRSMPSHLSQGWMTIPLAMLVDAGIDAEQITAKTDLSAPIALIAQQAETTLKIARRSRVQKSGHSVCLLGTLAEGHGTLLKKTGWNLFDSTLSKPQTMPIQLIWRSIFGKF